MENMNFKYQGNMVGIEELPKDALFDLRVDLFKGALPRILRGLRRDEISRHYDPNAQSHYIAVSKGRK